MTRKTTLKDVAKACGVSTALVSYALNDKGSKCRVSEEMVKLIKAKAAEMDYQPNNVAVSLRSGTTRTIGIILSDISNRFFADIARCIEDCASKDGYTVIIGSTDENPEKMNSLIDVFVRRGVDGLIIVPCMGTETKVSALLDRKIPIVLMDRDLYGLSVSSVTLDNMKAMSLAVSEFIRQGVEKIGLISFNTDFSNICDREQGYRKAMTDAGLEDNIYVRNASNNRNVYDEMETLMAQVMEDGVRAVIFSTNRLAIDSLRVLMKMKMRVPDDLALMAFDGSETFAFELYPTSISYVKQPMEEFGLNAYEILMESIRMKDIPKSVKKVLEPSLVCRESSQIR